MRATFRCRTASSRVHERSSTPQGRGARGLPRHRYRHGVRLAPGPSGSHAALDPGHEVVLCPEKLRSRHGLGPADVPPGLAQSRGKVQSVPWRKGRQSVSIQFALCKVVGVTEHNVVRVVVDYLAQD